MLAISPPPFLLTKASLSVDWTPAGSSCQSRKETCDGQAEAAEPATTADEGVGGETDAEEEDQSVEEPIEEEGESDEPVEESVPEPEGDDLGESDEVP